MRISGNLSIASFRRFLAERFVPLWYRWYRTVFFLGFVAVLGFGGWLWYYNLYQYSWGEEEKRAYQESSFKQTDFKAEKFRRIIEVLKDREISHLQGHSPERDLFR